MIFYEVLCGMKTMVLYFSVPFLSDGVVFHGEKGEKMQRLLCIKSVFFE